MYLDIDMQKLLDRIHDKDDNEILYFYFLQRLVKQRVRNEVVDLFTTTNVAHSYIDLGRWYGAPQHVLYLDIRYCKTIKNGDLDEFVNLRGLDMSDCKQETIRNGFLDKLVNLQTLTMCFCD